jgi:hypothetical protein
VHHHQIRKEIVMFATGPCSVMLAEASLLLSMRMAAVGGVSSQVS